MKRRRRSETVALRSEPRRGLPSGREAVERRPGPTCTAMTATAGPATDGPTERDSLACTGALGL
jgi:hypothetical protein